MIEEIGGRPIKAGESFGAAYVVGFFDSPAEMEAVYDIYSWDLKMFNFACHQKKTILSFWHAERK